MHSLVFTSLFMYDYNDQFTMKLFYTPRSRPKLSKFTFTLSDKRSGPV